MKKSKIRTAIETIMCKENSKVYIDTRKNGWRIKFLYFPVPTEGQKERIMQITGVEKIGYSDSFYEGLTIYTSVRPKLINVKVARVF